VFVHFADTVCQSARAGKAEPSVSSRIDCFDISRFFLAATSVLREPAHSARSELNSEGISIRLQHRRRAVWPWPSSYFLGRLRRTMEKYITARAAS